MKRKTLLGILAVVLASMCYGITPILSNAALNGGLPADFVIRFFGENALPLMQANEARKLPNESVVAFSMGIACILSLINCLIARKSPKVQFKQAWQLVVMGGGAFALTCLLISFAYNYIPAGMTIVLHFTYPVFVLLASLLFFREKPTVMKICSLSAALIGIVLMSEAGFKGDIKPIGIVLALLSGVTYATYFLAGRNASYNSLDTPVSNTYITGAACVVCLIVGLITGRLCLPSDWFMWLILFFEALLGYTVGLQLLLIGIKLVGSTTSSALNTLEPAFATLTSMIVFGETLGLLKGIGVVLVLLAAVFSIIAVGKHESRQPEMKDN